MSHSRFFTGTCQQWAHDVVGSVATMTAIIAFASIGAAAIAVDSSSFYIQKRKLQSAVDMAAMAAAGQDTSSAARTSLMSNGIVPATLSVVTGTYIADPSLPSSSRFVPGSDTAAARVSATIYAPMLLGRVFGAIATNDAPAGSIAISATGTAAALPVAVFAIGSRLASLNAGLTNGVLSALTGGNISLSLLDYQSLASTKVDFGPFLQGVAARIGGSSGTYADVLGANIPLSTVLSVLGSTGDTKVSAAVASVLTALPRGSGTVVLGKLVSLGSSSSLPVNANLPVSVTMSAYDILSQVTQLAASGRTASIDLGVAVPGITDAVLSVSVGSNGPATAVAPYATTTTASTNQVRIALSTRADFLGLGSVSLPLVLDLGSASATTKGPTCNAGQPSLTLGVTPSAAALAIGVPASTGAAIGPGPIALLLGLTVSAYGSATSASSTAQVSFLATDVTSGTVKTTTSSSPIASLASSALGNLKLSVGTSSAQLPLPTPMVNALGSALASLTMPASTILDAVTRSLGVGIGQADTWVSDLKCGMPALVQ